MRRQQQTNRSDDVLDSVGHSLREWASSREEERGALDRVWTGLRWKANQVPAEAVRSVELGPRPARWNRRSTVWATAAAALVIVAVGGAIVWPRGAQVYAAGADGLQVTLADDSRVEMRARAEMAVGRAPDGIQIDLKTGDIIVTAAEQRGGRLYVRTKDMTVALSAVAQSAKVDVAGTVFLVKAGENGSRVAVIEGEVRVREGNVETRLRPGEQVATSPVLAARPVRDDILWSRNADVHVAILESFAKGMAQTAGPLVPLNPGQGAAPADPEFEEASIRACDPDNMPPTPAGARGGGPNSFQMTPGRLYALCMTPAVLIRLAYRFRALPDESLSADTRRTEGWRLNQVSGQGAQAGAAVRGGPAWARDDRYSIEAVAGSDADGDTMSGPMLRSLLERRFKLKTHIETEEVPAWTLTVAPGGLKIKPMSPGECDPNPPPPPPEARTPTPRTFEEARSGATRICGIWAQPSGAGGVLWLAGGSSIGDLSQQLRSRLSGARITDMTGVADRFNFALELDADDQAALVAAVESQLGLRLEQTRVSREYLVIDAIERPSAN